MNEDLLVLGNELERRFMAGDNSGRTCDITDWISYFAWDFLGDMTWSKRMGFMEQGKDVGGMLQTAENVMRYFSVVRQYHTVQHAPPLTLPRSDRFPHSTSCLVRTRV